MALASLQGDRLMDAPTINAGSLISLLPAVIFFLIFQRTLTRGITAGAVKMKFTDGYWLVRAGVLRAAPAASTSGPGRRELVTVYAAHRADHRSRRHPEPARGDGGVLLPGPGRHRGDDRALLRRAAQAARRSRLATGAERPVTIEATTTTPACLTSGRLTARVRIGDHWRVDFIRGDRVVTSSTERSIGIVTDRAGRRFVHEQLALGVGETVYGLGERFGAFVKNGQSVDIWNADGGTASEQAYKNVPFYLTNRGLRRVRRPPRARVVRGRLGGRLADQFSVEGQSLTYYVIDGPTPKDVLRRYTALTGRPARVPAWSFGLWLSTSFTTDYDEATVTGFIDGMAERDLPLSVFHFDCFWMREFHWCDFEWDPRTFPDPEAMLRRLKARGLKVCVWINPYIAQRSPLFAEGRGRATW